MSDGDWKELPSSFTPKKPSARDCMSGRQWNTSLEVNGRAGEPSYPFDLAKHKRDRSEGSGNAERLRMARTRESSSSDQTGRHPTTETRDLPDDRLRSEADRSQHAGTADCGRSEDFASMMTGIGRQIRMANELHSIRWHSWSEDLDPTVVPEMF